MNDVDPSVSYKDRDEKTRRGDSLIEQSHLSRCLNTISVGQLTIYTTRVGKNTEKTMLAMIRQPLGSDGPWRFDATACS